MNWLLTNKNTALPCHHNAQECDYLEHLSQLICRTFSIVYLSPKVSCYVQIDFAELMTKDCPN